jgi:hypothetical protein
MEAFSTNDIYYIKAAFGTGSDAETEYKNKVDKLNTLKESNGLTEKQNTDLNISQNALILNNVTLGVGIFAMMWMVYNK